MEMTFRWYGDNDPVPLEKIRQIPGVTGIVTAIYDIPVGQPWPLDKILALKAKVERAGLSLSVIESVPVHEDIKLGKPMRDRYIAHYCETLANLGLAGIHTVCYNFMPVFDWTRSSLHHILPDGSTTLAYDRDDIARMDPATGSLSLPGWDSSYTREHLTALLDEYARISREQLWSNLAYFLQKVVAAAEKANIKLAIHPDDPPWDIFGLPRLITDKQALLKFVRLVDSPYNGITLCTGSLGVLPSNDVADLIETFGTMGRIHFAHCRNIRITGDHSFEESAHLSSSGSLDMYRIIKALHDSGFDGPIRPDHGRMIWSETGKPGYGLYDRALGAAYLNGLWEAVSKAAGERSKE